MGLEEKYSPIVKSFVQDHLHEDPAHLLFKYHGTVDFDLKFAVQQISARQKVKSKLPSWTCDPDIVFPVSISLEQSSSEATARYKAAIMSGSKMLDLTGGLGIDTFFGGANFDKVTYVERNEELCEIAEHNFGHLSVGKITVFQGDAIDYLSDTDGKFDWIYIDPARRGDHNQKLYRLSDCEPDIVKHWALIKEKASNVLVKASPILDIKAVLEERPDVQRVVILAVKNEVKEILLLSKGTADEGKVVIECIELSAESASFTFTMEDEGFLGLKTSYPKRYLIEPHATILKAGGFKSFSEQYKLPKLQVNSHLYTTDDIKAEVMGKVYEIISEVKSDKKLIRKLFPSGKVNVVVRNYPIKAEEIKTKFRLKDGGEDFLIATTTQDGKPRMFHCKKAN